MVSKMKPATRKGGGSRIASVHNGSSLFTGDAGGGESNIRRYIIENDLLEGIIQMPNNLFYNTGITTYIWLLSNNKAAHRKGKVQLIDAGQLYRKLRKNLGDKNCEFAPEHITEILRVYRSMEEVNRVGDDGIASKVFDNADFGYYKVTIERPRRLSSQFDDERVETLRYDKTLREPMQWIHSTFKADVPANLSKHAKEITAWCDKQELNLTPKQLKELLSPALWEKHDRLFTTAIALRKRLGDKVFTNFNEFTDKVSDTLKELDIKLSTLEKNALLNAVSWYDSEADKVVKGVVKLTGDKLSKLLHNLGCTAEQLPHYGYFPTSKKGEYIEYETN